MVMRFAERGLVLRVQSLERRYFLYKMGHKVKMASGQRNKKLRNKISSTL